MSIVVPLEGFGGGSGGGGGAGLNYAITGGLLKPTSPKNNMIWVDTDIDIKGHAFATTAPARVSDNKNLLVYPYHSTTRTNNGITYTDNGDGTITVKGTPTAVLYFTLLDPDEGMVLPAGTYHISGCPAGGGEGTYNLAVGYSYDNWATKAWANDYGNGATFTLEKPARISCNIGIQTGVAVSSIVFRPQLEKGASGTSFVKGTATGQVWIVTGLSSSASFNALKSGGSLMVYPVGANQCISGEWTDKTVEVYQNGAWSSLWDGTLYDNGNTYDAYTGGYEAVGTASLTLKSDSMEVSGSVAGGVYTVKQIDLTGYSKVRFEWTAGAGGIDTRFVLSKTKGEKYTTAAAVVLVTGNVGTRYTTEVNVPEDGSYYVGFGRFAAGGANKFTVHKITPVR